MTSAVTQLTAITTISNVETLFTFVLPGALVPGAVDGLALVPGAIGGLALVPGALGRLVLFWNPVVDVIIEPAILVLVYTVEGEGWSSRVGEAVVVSCDWTTGAKLNK